MKTYQEMVKEYKKRQHDTVVDAIATTDTDRNDKPLTEQRMKTVRVETFGVDYGEPEKIVE